MMNRRSFILAAAAFAAASSRTDASAAGPALGLQLYTVRELMAEDAAATLDLVASVGYREVEFADYFGTAPAEWRRRLSAAGLAAPSAHVGFGEFAADTNRVVEHALAIGHQFVVVPSVPEEARATLDDYRRHAEHFNRWGETCAGAGLRFAYHNHRFEFDTIDGRSPYDLLLRETDPACVAMELDLAWATGGNSDPLHWFRSWPGRFPLVHIKDFDPGEGEVDIGQGEVAFGEIFAAAKLAGIEHGFVERDHPADAKGSVRQNYAAIRPAWDRYLNGSKG